MNSHRGLGSSTVLGTCLNAAARNKYALVPSNPERAPAPEDPELGAAKGFSRKSDEIDPGRA